jgi:hypothetical protein
MTPPKLDDSVATEQCQPAPFEDARDPSPFQIAASAMLQQAGNLFADKISTNHETNPEVRQMLRDFGLLLQDASATLVPPPPPIPNWTGEAYSAVDGFRGRLQKAGIDPDKLNGIGIGVLDFHENEGDNSHGKQVSGVIGDQKYGLSHGATLVAFEKSSEKDKAVTDLADNPSDSNLGELISAMASGSVNKMCQSLQAVVADGRAKDIRVLNVSLGMNNVVMAQQLFDQMMANPEKSRPWLEKLAGKEFADKWIASAVNQRESPETKALDKVLYESLLKSVDKVLTNDPKFKDAMSKYQQVTKQAADGGLTIVVAVSNAQQSLEPFGVQTPAGAGYNYFAQSDHVIAVGACDLNATPARNSDDYVAGFSSHGTARYHPTVVAHGSCVSSRWEGIEGTSFATPLVSATIGLMLAQNSSMSFSQIKDVLTQNSSRLRGQGVEAQGAGELNVDQAILAARALGRRPS